MIPKIEGSRSQLGQDCFVAFVLNNKFGGTYIEIGSSHPIEISNTYLLETKFGFTGCGFEIDEIQAKEFNKVRLNKTIIADATKVDYREVFQSKGLPSVIDYLQVDIEPTKNTFSALIQVIKSGYKFNVITFEHDVYSNLFNYVYKISAFIFLKAKGYKLVASNVRNGKLSQEDWYVNKQLKFRGKLRKNTDFRLNFL